MLIAVSVFTILLLLSVVTTFVHNDFWVFKIMEYPRLQKMVLIVLGLAGWIMVWNEMSLFHQVLFGGLVAAAVYNAIKIFPYTFIATKELKKIKLRNTKRCISIFSANVFQENREYAKMLAQIKACLPDVILLLETDKSWSEHMSELHAEYPYRLIHPLSNTYGLLFYSKLRLEDGKVLCRIKENIPSIEGKLVLPDGTKVQMWGVHPEPPVPGENLYATAKDKELMQIALQAAKCKLPCFVFGDFNDVAWSHTTIMFRKISQLLDPRIGRGFYSTFSAHHWWLRFPLDYIFCSSDFSLVSMKRLPPNGSDHFATFVQLQYTPASKKKQSAPEASAENIREAKAIAMEPLH